MIVALNNKCNLTKEEFTEYSEKLKGVKTDSTMILCPTSLFIPMFSDERIALGSQNVSMEDNGAHTGEISAKQLKSFGVTYSIVGHSERRKDQKETDEEINAKIKKLLENDITPILCVGETLEEREAGRAMEVINSELDIDLKDLTEEEKERIVIAYEPIWSIGTGVIPTNEEIKEVFDNIKANHNNKVLYGGSANDKNIQELRKVEEIDGYLLGGLSLKPDNLQVFVNNL